MQTQAQYDAAMARWLVYRDQFRADRDEAVRRAIQEGVDKKDVCLLLGVTPQWLNKLLRGQAYRRRTD